MSIKTEEAKIVEEEIRKLALRIFPYGMWHDHPNGYERHIEWITKQLTQALTTYKESILAECEKCVPEEDKREAEGIETFRQKQGFNTCRTQTLQAINSLKV